MLRPALDLLRWYRDALSREPRMRRYLGATLVDDVGVAVTAWASFLLQTNLFPAGQPLLDEHGRPRLYKKHLLSFGAMTSAFQSLAALAGLLAGGAMIELVHHAYWPLFAFDVFTNIVFLVIVARSCRPAAESAAGPAAGPAQRALGTVAAAWKRPPVLVGFGRSIQGGLRFLFAEGQRPLLALLIGSWMVELVSEAYDGKMIVKQVLHGSEDAVRRALIAWTLVSMIALLVLPSLARRKGSLGRVFLALMLVDGLLIAWAGRIACVPVVASILPFAIVLGFDHTLTLSATTLVDVAANSASSAGMRG